MDIANLQIKADSKQVTQAIKALKGLGIEARVVEGKTKNLERSTDRLSGSLRSAAKAAGSFVAAYAGIQGIRALTRISDQYTVIENKLKLVTNSTSELNRVQKELIRISDDTFTSLSDNATLFNRLAISTSELGASSNEVLDATKALQQTFRISGATAAEAANSAIQFSQGLAAGALRGDEFRSVAEQNIRLQKLLAEGLGVTTGELKRMADEGLLTTEKIFPILTENLEKLNKEAENISPTFEQAFNKITEKIEQGLNKSIEAESGFGDLAETLVAYKGHAEVFGSAMGVIIGKLVSLTTTLDDLERRELLKSDPTRGLPGFLGSIEAFFSEGEISMLDKRIKKEEEAQNKIKETQKIISDIREQHERESIRLQEFQGGFTFAPDAPIPGRKSDVPDDVIAKAREKARERLAKETENLAKENKNLSKSADEVNKRIGEDSFVALNKSKSALQQYGEEARNVTAQLQDMGVRGLKSLEDNLVGLIRGTVSVADAFRSMADQIIDDLIRIQVRQQITEPLSGALNSLIPSIGGALFGGSAEASFAAASVRGAANPTLFDPGFATGGSFTVGGSGGPDSQLVPLRLTPGEIVNVRKGGQQEQKAPNIIINNNAPQAQVSAGVGANGFDINVVIDDAFANNASRRGTKTFNTLNNLGTPLSRG